MCWTGEPTAKHSVPAHETLVRRLVPGGFGVVWIVQLVPSQRSASVLLGKVPEVAKAPTAVHAVAAVHETEVSAAAVAPAGVGALWTVQLVPFQVSTRTWVGALAGAVS